MQGLKQQYTAELAGIQEAAQAAAQAIRQRLKRITGDRTSGATASGKTPTGDTIRQPPATSSSAAPPLVDTATSSQLPVNSAPVAAQHGDPSNTAAAAQAQAVSQGPSPMSNLPLSASWGTAAPEQAPLTAQQLPQQAGFAQPAQRAQQEGQSPGLDSSDFSVPQEAPPHQMELPPTVQSGGVSHSSKATLGAGSTDGSSRLPSLSHVVQSQLQASHPGSEPQNGSQDEFEGSTPDFLTQRVGANDIDHTQVRHLEQQQLLCML